MQRALICSISSDKRSETYLNEIFIPSRSKTNLIRLRMKSLSLVSLSNLLCNFPKFFLLILSSFMPDAIKYYWRNSKITKYYSSPSSFWIPRPNESTFFSAMEHAFSKVVSKLCKDSNYARLPQVQSSLLTNSN